MKKFLLTLLFCIFANPIFAQTKPTTKTNIDIKINKKETESSLNNIKTNFTGYIETNLCNTKQKENINSIKDKEFKNEICDSNTIGETYNCICDKNNPKYKTFYKSVEAITDFSTLTGTTVNQFQQIKNFYDALTSLTDLITSADELSKEIKKLIKQDEEDKATRDAAINALKQRLSNDLAKKLEEEKNLRKEHPDIVKDLDKKLRPHTNNDIKDYMTDKKNDATKAAQNYIDKELNDLLNKNPNITTEELENLYKQNNDSEDKITEDNIKAIKDEMTNKEKAEKDTKLAELLRLKKEEANLINELGKTKTPAVTVEQINDTNYNDSNTNKKLNEALDKLIEGKSPHPTDENARPNDVAKTIEKINEDITNANENITKLKELKDKLDTEKNKLNKDLNDNYKKISDLLHEQNKLECKIFGQIDVIKGNISGYKALSISGAYITCGNDEKEGKLNAQKTLNQMLEVESLTEKAKWNKCLENKIRLLNINMKEDTNLEKTGPIDRYIRNIMKKYPGIEKLNCDFKCTNEAANYEYWYNKSDGKTLSTYKDKNGKTLEEQIKECQLASKENAINNFTCPDNITVDIESIRKEMKKEINKNLDDILKIGEQKCKEAQIRAQEEEKKASIHSDLTQAIKELQGYCCNGKDFNERNCSAETNIMGQKGNYRVKLSDSSATKIKELLKYVSTLKCPDDKDIINDVHNRIFIDTIYIGNSQTPNTQCDQNRKNISNNLNQRYSTSNTSESKNYLGLTKNFCKWNG